MILLIHHHSMMVSCIDNLTGEEVLGLSSIASSALIEVAALFPQRWLVWCDKFYLEQLDIELLKSYCTHKRIMVSANRGKNQFFGKSIGYIDESPFINVREGIKYPTWQMSDAMGAIFGMTLSAIDSKMTSKKSFSFFLCSIAKMGQLKGLMCYQIPLIPMVNEATELTSSQLYQFIALHYKKKWLLFLFFCEWRYNNRFHLIQLVSAVVQPKVSSIFVLPELDVRNDNNATVDILIPTIGREIHLENVLEDLRTQSVLPKRVILIEQDPTGKTKSKLPYLKEREWPFEIIHQVINDLGACNARNMGMQHLESDWVFFADDDIRFESHLIQNSLNFAATYRCSAFTMSCLQSGEREKRETPVQWHSFGSGCSFVKSSKTKGIYFDVALEHGYGEDTDYGNQLRKNGTDIVYAPHIQVNHLKASTGGFRKSKEQPWAADDPKPSPTVILSILKHWTKEQIAGYKLKLLLGFYKHQNTKNPLKYYKEFNKRWQTSIYWSDKIRKETL